MEGLERVQGAVGAPVPVPMRPGSVLLLHRLTEHSSLSNLSDGIRWSFDLRYQPVGQPTGRPVASRAAATAIIS